jgi:uncharacterized membrane protein (UPF0127 family)
VKTRELVVQSGRKKISLRVEIAGTYEERRDGLMWRKHLSKGAGMLFLFPDEDHHPFWMKNTKIPLDLWFVREDGTIADLVLGMRPGDTEMIYPSVAVRRAIEVPAGWTKERGIRVGDRVFLV